MKVAFVINCRNKQDFIAMSIQGALSQTYPCEIIISDQQSTDRSRAVIDATVDALGPTHHEIRVRECQIAGSYGMKAMNDHMRWLMDQTDAEWLFQSSADDYSLPDRVKVCMEAVEKNPCSAVATTMFFLEPGQKLEGNVPVSGFPQQSGYVKAGEGLLKLAYGSTIGGYRRDFLLKVGDLGPNTPDVLLGFLAALDQGFYVVANPQHVHCTHANTENTGMQGRLRGARTKRESKVLAELNHMQLFRLYKKCLDKAQELHPEGILQDHLNPLYSTLLGQAFAWIDAREVLREEGVQPELNA
mgnify:CR=1